MYVSFNRVLLTQKEAVNLIEFLLRAIWSVDNASYIRTLSNALHSMIVVGKPLIKNQFDWLMEIDDRVNVSDSFGRIDFVERSGSYYRSLYDSKLPLEKRQKAKKYWQMKVMDKGIEMIDSIWLNYPSIIEKMVSSNVQDKKIDDIIAVMKKKYPEFRNFDRHETDIYIPVEIINVDNPSLKEPSSPRKNKTWFGWLRSLFNF